VFVLDLTTIEPQTQSYQSVLVFMSLWILAFLTERSRKENATV
jgi:hypothetical protein